MRNFKLISTEDSAKYKEKIFELWDISIPGTPHERLNWMQEGNPAGPSIWFLALDPDTNGVIGSISVMPKNILFRGQTVRAGILGDFMVREQSKAYGPGIRLPKMVASYCRDIGFDILYTIPNQSAERILRHCGFAIVNELSCYVKPIDYQFYLEKHFPKLAAKLLGSIAEAASRVASMEMYHSIKGMSFIENCKTEAQYSTLWNKVKYETQVPLSDRSLEFIKWRYFENPQYKFVMLACINGNNPMVPRSYAIYSIRNGAIHLYDILPGDEGSTRDILKKIIEIARMKRLKAIYVMISNEDKMLKLYRTFGFINGKEKIKIYGISLNGSHEMLADWKMTSGDRNI
jgi:hypothetical protein